MPRHAGSGARLIRRDSRRHAGSRRRLSDSGPTDETVPESAAEPNFGDPAPAAGFGVWAVGWPRSRRQIKMLRSDHIVDGSNYCLYLPLIFESA